MHTSDQNNLDTFITLLIDQKGFTNLTPERKEQMVIQLHKRIDEFVMARTLAQFSEEELQEFKQLLKEKKTRAELQEFAISKIPDYTAFLTTTLQEFEGAYVGTSALRKEDV